MLILMCLAAFWFFVVPGIFLSIEDSRRRNAHSPGRRANPPRVAAKAAVMPRHEVILGHTAIPNRN